MASESSLDAFERAFGSPSQGEPAVTPEEEKEQGVDSLTAFERAFETSAVSLNNAESTPDEDESFFDKVFAQPFQRAVARNVATMERVASTAQAGTPEGIAAAMEDPEVLRQQYQQSTTLPSVLLQTVANPISLAFDSASNAILAGAEGLVSLLPDETQEWAMDQINAVLNTKEGQLVMNAAAEGYEEYQKFKETNPDIAANFESAFDIFGGVPKRVVQDATIDLIPLRMDRVGLRRETAPLRGIDKDLYNIAYNTGKKTPEQTKLTTDPSGLSGRTEVLATEDQLKVVDLLKTAGVRGDQPLQTNLNKINAYVEKLDDRLISMSRKQRKPIEVGDISARVRENAQKVMKENPSVFQTKAAKQEFAKLYKNFIAQVENQGTSVEGVIAARRAFDRQLERLGVDVGSDKLTASILSGRAVRNAVNEAIYAVMPEAEEIFSRMSSLIPVIDTVTTKASKSASTALGRYVQELGLDSLVGETATSKVINAGYTLGVGVALSPYVLIKRQLKKTAPAQARAKVGYILQDIKREIQKGMKRLEDPKTKKNLLKQQATVYAGLEAAARAVIAELEAEEENVNTY